MTGSVNQQPLCNLITRHGNYILNQQSHMFIMFMRTNKHTELAKVFLLVIPTCKRFGSTIITENVQHFLFKQFH